MAPVQKGDTITFQELSKPVTVEWDKFLSKARQNYRIARFKSQAPNGLDGLIFIQDDMVSSLDSKKQEGVYTVTIDGAYQYGELDELGRGRYVVLHNKKQKPLQWNILEPIVTGDWFPGGDILAIYTRRGSQAQMQTVGDTLRDF